MENKKRKSTGLLLSILGVISLVLITAGVTYAFFSYAKQGVTPNTISTGTITFVYNEDSEAGLEIQNALPKSDSVGMNENSSNAFLFSVTSTTPTTATIDYIVTARMDSSSTLPTDQVKLYLTTTQGAETAGSGYGVLTGTTAGAIKTFADLTNVKDTTYSSIVKTTTVGTDVVEKVLYKGQIAAGSDAYTRNFKLNMWLVGANEVTTPASCSVALESGVELNEANCSDAGGVYTAASTTTSTSGIADYSAYEFVNLSALTVDVAGSCSDSSASTEEACNAIDGATWTATTYKADALKISDLTEGTTWLRSVPYYSGIEGGTLNASEWTRIAYVNYATGEIVTVAQNASQPAGEDWEASEQYYPLNSQTFKVTVNVYAEGATTYSTGS